jgi:hypothetical protein
MSTPLDQGAKHRLRPSCCANWKTKESDAKMTEIRVLLGVLGVLLLVGFAAGCGLVSDQTKQEAKKKVEDKGQQVKQEVKKKVEAGQENLKK